MTTRPGFIWSGTEWVAIGQEAVSTPVYYQATEPSGAATGSIWVDSDASSAIINNNDFVLKTDVEAYIPHPFLMMGA